MSEKSNAEEENVEGLTAETPSPVPLFGPDLESLGLAHRRAPGHNQLGMEASSLLKPRRASPHFLLGGMEEVEGRQAYFSPSHYLEKTQL